MAITSVAARGSGIVGSSGTSSLAVTPGTLMAVGSVLLVAVSGAGTASVTGIQCATGSNNVFSFVGRFQDSTNDTWTEIWYCRLRTALASTGTYTVFLSTSQIDWCVAGWEFGTTAGFGLHQVTAGVGNGVAGAVGYGSAAFSGLASLSRLYVRALGKAANTTTTITASASFTSWALALRTRNATAARTLRAEHRINTSVGETSNPTLAVTGNTAAFFAALEELGAATISSPLAENITRTGSTSSITTNQGTGSLYIIYQLGSQPTPTATQIRNGLSGTGGLALVTGNGAITTSGVHTFGDPNSLSPNTSYTIAFVHTNEADVDSNVAAVTFTTLSDSTTATIATTLKAPVQSAAVVEKIPTTIATTLKAPVQSAAVVEKMPSTIATVLKAPVQAAAVVEKMPSTIATVLKAPVQAASANVVVADHSTIATALFGLTQLAVVLESIPSTINTTLKAPVQSAAVVERIPSTINTTLFGPTQSAAVVESIPSTINTTLFGPVQSDSTIESIPTAIHMTLFGIVQSAAVVESTPATIATVLQAPVQAAAVVESIPSTINTTLFGLTQSAAVAERIPTTIETTLFGPTQAASANVVVGDDSTIATALFGLTQLAVVLESIPSTINTTLKAPVQSAAVVERIPAAITTTLFGLQQSASASTFDRASITTVLRGLQQAIIVEEIEPTHIGQTLRGITQSADVAVDNPAVPVFGQIAITFRGFSQRADAEIILPTPVEDEHEGDRGRGGGSAPKEIPPHEWEVDLFRAKEYRRNFDMAVPPVVIANVALGSIASPPPRPVSVPLPPFVKPQ